MPKQGRVKTKYPGVYNLFLDTPIHSAYTLPAKKRVLSIKIPGKKTLNDLTR